MLIHYRHAISNDFKALHIDEESELGHNVCRDVQKHYKKRRHDVDFQYCDCLPKTRFTTTVSKHWHSILLVKMYKEVEYKITMRSTMRGLR